MGKSNQSASLSTITGIVSGVMAQMEQNSAVLVQDNTLIVQLNKNSDNCKNRVVTRSHDTYVSYSTVFESDVAVQTMYATIMNSLSASFDNEQTGASLNKSVQELAATIQNILVTTLTQESITNYVSSVNTSQTYVQICHGSRNGGNFIYGSSKDIYDFYYEQYTKMAQVQQVSADISNTIDASFKSKQTGLLAMLTRMIAVICIVIILVIGIVVVIVIFGLFGG